MPPKRGGAFTTDPNVLLKRRQERQRANEKMQNILDEQGIRRTENENNLPFATIPQVLLINQKNYYTEYLKKDENYIMMREDREHKIEEKNVDNDKEAGVEEKNIDNDKGAGVEEKSVDNGKEKDGDAPGEENDTLVLHPGSHGIKIGFAKDVDPLIIPNYIGYAKRGGTGPRGDVGNGTDKYDVTGLVPERELVGEGGDSVNDRHYQLVDHEKFEKLKKRIYKSYKERMKYYKRRILPNCHEACFNFNRKQQHEDIQLEDVGDEEHKNMFIKAKKLIEKGRDYVVGDEIFRLNDESEWTIRQPFSFKKDSQNKVEMGFNYGEYKNVEENLDDIERLLKFIMKKKFKMVQRKEFERFNLVLVVPSLSNKEYVERMIDLMFNRFGFKYINIIQEGVSISYGLGMSSGCLVDVGYSSIHINCIDEGIVVEDSRVILDYGMKDVIAVWGKMLVEQQFPLIKVDFRKMKDMKLLESLFLEHGTFDDSKTGVIQVGNFNIFESNKKFKRYQFKIFDENILAPMGMFYPAIFGERVVGGTIGGDYSGYENLNDKGSLLQLIESSGVLFSEFEPREQLLFLSELLDGNVHIHIDELIDKFGNGGIGNGKSIGNNKRNGQNRANLFNTTPLEIAILESIIVAGITGGCDQGKLDKYFGNIAVVGGGASLEGFEMMLLDRIHIARSALLGGRGLARAVKVARAFQEELEKNNNEGEKAGEKGGDNGGAKEINKGRLIISDEQVDAALAVASGNSEEESVRGESSDNYDATVGNNGSSSSIGGVGVDVDVVCGNSNGASTATGCVAWKGGSVFARMVGGNTGNGNSNGNGSTGGNGGHNSGSGGGGLSSNAGWISARHWERLGGRALL